jgi:pimeloyl-ACP methyl ester carboxylesterase
VWTGRIVLTTLLLAIPMGLESWCAELLCRPPNAGCVPPPGAPPSDARALRIERAGAVLESFVFAGPAAPRGTVVVLHGVRDEKTSFEDMARVFVARGYRAVLPDLRGHGHSSGDVLTYGVEEAADLSATLDALEAEIGSLGPLAVVGASYGGAVALHFAASDARARAVATIATFASLRAILPGYPRLVLPFLPAAPDWAVDYVVADASARVGVDYRACGSVSSVRAAHVPMLFLHGENDAHISPDESDRLASACEPGRCVLERRAGHGHVSMIRDLSIWERVADYFDEQLR